MTTAARLLVLDTNIVLDLWVYQDAATSELLSALQTGGITWLATAHMRAELERVLDYPHIAQRRALHGVTVAAVLAQFDALSQRVPDAPRAPYVCKDPDDQCFIDVAVQYRAGLISKDKQVLRLRNRLAKLAVAVRPVFRWADSGTAL